MYNEKVKIIKKSLGSHYHSNDEIIFFCPKCKHHKRKLSVNIEKNKFQCWVCEFKGSNLSRLITDRDLRTQWNNLTRQVDISRFDETFLGLSEPEPIKPDLELPEYFSSLTSGTLSMTGKVAKNYLLNRGVSNSDIFMYKMGFCHHGPYKNRIIVPSFDLDGKLNYFVARSFDDAYLKYKNPPCSRNVIFNDIFIDWNKPVVLVEGFFDSLKYKNSIPILGSTLTIRSKLFEKVIENCKKVFICLDKDARSKELKIAKNLLDFGVEVSKIELYEYSDLGEVPNHLLEEYKKRASLITREDYLLRKINFGG